MDLRGRTGRIITYAPRSLRLNGPTEDRGKICPLLTGLLVPDDEMSSYGLIKIESNSLSVVVYGAESTRRIVVRICGVHILF